MPLAERMILAMEAGQAKGGDSRWGNLQSAAIKIADPNDPGRGGDHIALAIEVGEHAEPVGEMKRIYYTTGRRLGYRTFSRVEGPDVIELKRMLHALGYWRPSLAAFPDAPPNANSPKMQELRKTESGRLRQGDRRSAPGVGQPTRATTRSFDDEAIAAVDKFRADEEPQLPGQSAGPRRSAFRRRAEGGVSREAQSSWPDQRDLSRRDVAWATRVALADARASSSSRSGPTSAAPRTRRSFSSSARSLGTAHSPGYPFYVMATYAVHARADSARSPIASTCSRRCAARSRACASS